MKYTKLLLPLVLSLALPLTLLTGCGSKPDAAPETVRVGSLKGPTTMGIVSMMNQTDTPYDFTMVTAAEELLGQMATDALDIALIPANAAANLYQKMDGALAVININTLGVLYVVTGDSSVTALPDLAGRTLFLTGKGATPDYAIQYLLEEYGVEDVTLEYKSEAAEVAAALAEDSSCLGLLPQPFAAAAMAKNDALSIAIDLSAQWDALENGSRLVTGVTVVRRDFLETYPQTVADFLESHAASVAFTAEQPEETAALIAKAGIVPQTAVALQALPYCRLVCLTGEDMKTALSGYLAVLYEQNSASVGGAMPGDDFYYIPAISAGE